MYRATMQLAARLGDAQYEGNKSHNAVFRYGTSNLVAVVYHEHVNGWFAKDTMTSDERVAHQNVARWIRRLETGHTARLFDKEPQMDQTWWDVQVRQVVSRNAGNRRLTLPMEDEIDLCVTSVQPHYVAWLMDWVDERDLKLDLFPEGLLYRVHESIANLSPAQFNAIVATSKRLYRLGDRAKLSRKHFLEKSFPDYRTAPWPGLRLCPPFFPDLNTRLPAPSRNPPAHKNYIVVHACMEEAFAMTVEMDSSKSYIREIKTKLQPHHEMIGLQLTDANKDHVLEVLHRLDKMHPQAFHPGPQSPYAVAARVLAPLHLVGSATTTSKPDNAFIKLPENACMDYEVGFSFTMAPPAAATTTPRTEPFYEVKVDDRVFYISSYTGFGLRLRYKLLNLIRGGEWRNKSAAIIVPDRLDAYVLENIMRTCVDWLHDLGLTDVKLVSESICNAMSLGAHSIISQRNSNSLWVSMHDGAAQYQILGVRVQDQDIMRDEWQGDYTCSPFTPRILERLRDFVLRHPSMMKYMHASDAPKRLLVDSVKAQSLSILKKIDKDLSHQSQAFATFKIVLNDGHHVFDNIQLARQDFDEWISYALTKHLQRQSWWTEFSEKTKEAKGVLVSGGLFEVCETHALVAVRNILGPNARLVLRKNRLSTIHGAVLAIYAEKGHRRVWLSHPEQTEDFLPVPQPADL